MTVSPITWRDIAAIYPTFVQWAAQRHGGLPDGPIKRDDYDRLAAEYAEASQSEEWRGVTTTPRRCGKNEGDD